MLHAPADSSASPPTPTTNASPSAAPSLLAAQRGVETSVLCLTDGQAATNRGDATSDEQLGQMRRAEFVASCKVLGVTNYRGPRLPGRPARVRQLLEALAGDLV